MLYLKADASTTFQSVDILYRFRRSSKRTFIAIDDHHPVSEEELEFVKDDKLTISVDGLLVQNNGFHRGKNKRTGKEGRIPRFKVEEEILTFAMPTLSKSF